MWERLASSVLIRSRGGADDLERVVALAPARPLLLTNEVSAWC